MIKNKVFTFKSIAVVYTMAMLFFACSDDYERVGEEAKKNLYPQGVAENYKLVYTEAKEVLSSEEVSKSNKIAVLTGEISEDFENLSFPHRTFPKGIRVEFFDKDGNKSVILSDYAIIYSGTSVIDLQGNVVIEMQDGKRLETTQLYYDQHNEWIFTQERFKYSDERDGTLIHGMGMDFNRDFTILNAHKTGDGYKIIKDKEIDG
ncbi:LPS export ABC transporter periplasmic protein LptC [Cellulophaga baltica]|uniref:LPS export ABC transporter periplasmic protein LptC n=1 Tax=Cellulophaga baltica TaxID=76594 RepID=UPI0024940C98|nr:LPS export ABC transporter periplasmic protein LptC [Cellulophaga baltica]